MFIPSFSGRPSLSEGGRKTVWFWIRGWRALHRAGQHLCWPSGARAGRAPLIPCRELLRRQVAETRVRAQVVVVVPPRLDDRARFSQASEHVLVEAYMDPASAQGCFLMLRIGCSHISGLLLG